MPPPTSFTAQTASNSQQSSCLSFPSASKTCGSHPYKRRGTWFVLKCWEVLAPGRGTSGSPAGHTAPGRDPSIDLVGAAHGVPAKAPGRREATIRRHRRGPPPATMRALLLLLLLPALELALRPPQSPEARDKLCGHHLVRALVRVCGGPRWSPEATQPVDAGDRELLRWLEQRQLLHALAADMDPALDPGPQPPLQAPQRHGRSAATSPVHRCCLTGCTQQDLLRLCPH
ncbi:insulin-like 3 [Mesocricetus auratus]|uniref:Insulin-like 3 n=1 Tax=Mesocricetus auratus TaxID=10036 RepID=A0A1U7RFH8_MESAU|nr:insulin-like 3 [Mesocricetus auratus]